MLCSCSEADPDTSLYWLLTSATFRLTRLCNLFLLWCLSFTLCARYRKHSLLTTALVTLLGALRQSMCRKSCLMTGASQFWCAFTLVCLHGWELRPNMHWISKTMIWVGQVPIELYGAHSVRACGLTLSWGFSAVTNLPGSCDWLIMLPIAHRAPCSL